MNGMREAIASFTSGGAGGGGGFVSSLSRMPRYLTDQSEVPREEILQTEVRLGLYVERMVGNFQLMKSFLRPFRSYG